MDFNNDFHKITLLTCDAHEQVQKICTASMLVLSYLANADKEVSDEEVSFLKYYLHNSFSVSKAYLNHAVYAYMMLQKSSNSDDSNIESACQFLKEHLNEAQKQSFLMALLKISAADQAMDQTEKNYIKNIGLVLGMKEHEITQEILTEQLKLLGDIERALCTDPDFSQNQKLEFVSVHEMLDDLGRITK